MMLDAMDVLVVREEEVRVILATNCTTVRRGKCRNLVRAFAFET
jgi:hypothetical protein